MWFFLKSLSFYQKQAKKYGAASYRWIIQRPCTTKRCLHFERITEEILHVQ
jgi:hypothetical protein